MTSINRRRLLQCTAAAFTTNLFTGLVRGANDRIAVGFVGVGGRAGDGLMVDFAKHLDCECVAVCDPFADRRARRAAQFEAVQAARRNAGSYRSASQYNDFRELLARKEIDAVVVATPDHWHVPVLMAAVQAGKDVYVEKPLSPSLHWNFAARDAVRRSGRVFQ